MKIKRLPKYVNPFELAENEAELSGVLSLTELQRVTEIICKQSPVEIKVMLKFSKSLEGLSIITGNIKTRLLLNCQRCIQPVNYDLDIDVQLSPVRSEKAIKDLPERYDPIIVTDETLQIIDLVEEELLLALPMAPSHEFSAGNCQII